MYIYRERKYFKGFWELKFKPKRTREKDFYVTPNTATKVQMMSQKGRFKYAKLQDLRVLELPYKDSTIVMQIILPDKNVDISVIENKVDVTLTSFADLGSRKQVTLKLPKFKIVQEIDLKQSLVEVNENMKDLLLNSVFEVDYVNTVTSMTNLR